MTRTPILDPIRQVVLHSPDLQLIHNRLIDVMEQLVTDNNLNVQGAIYSNSLIDDATDNIFYSVVIEPYTPKFNIERRFFMATVKFKHNAFLQHASFQVLPSSVRELGTPAEIAAGYVTSVTSGSAFPVVLSHLLIDAMGKLADELSTFTPTAVYLAGN